MSYPMKTLKWDSMFNPEEETSTTISWISFSSFSPNFFIDERVSSLATDKPLQVDVATKNKTRPSCTRSKEKVDLLGEFPKYIKIRIKRSDGEIMEK